MTETEVEAMRDGLFDAEWPYLGADVWRDPVTSLKHNTTVAWEIYCRRTWEVSTFVPNPCNVPYTEEHAKRLANEWWAYDHEHNPPPGL
jgi:hypothetical protein